MMLSHHIFKSNSYWSVHTCKRRKRVYNWLFLDIFFVFFPLLHVFTHQYELLLKIWWHSVIVNTIIWSLSKFGGNRSKIGEMKLKNQPQFVNIDRLIFKAKPQIPAPNILCQKLLRAHFCPNDIFMVLKQNIIVQLLFL